MRSLENPFIGKPDGPRKPEGELVRTLLGEEAEGIHALLGRKRRASDELPEVLDPATEMTEREKLLIKAASYEREMRLYFETAKTEILKEEDSFPRYRLWKKLSTAFAQYGYYRQAREISLEIEAATPERAEVLVALAETLAKAGEDSAQAFDEAEEATHQVTGTADVRSPVFSSLVLALSRVGNIERAKKLIDGITLDYDRCQALISVALEKHKVNQDSSEELAAAKERALVIKSLCDRSMLLSALGLALAQIGHDPTESFGLAEKYANDTEPEPRLYALSSLGAALAKSGLDPSRIFNLVEDSSSIFSPGGISSLAVAYAEAGNFERAKELVFSMVYSKYLRDEAFNHLIEISLENDDLETAEEIARGLEDAYQRSLGMSALASALARTEQDPSKELHQAQASLLDIRTEGAQVRALIALGSALGQEVKRLTRRAEELKR